jgi:uncharacterized protein YjiS (DUF1127 family)
MRRTSRRDGSSRWICFDFGRTVRRGSVAEFSLFRLLNGEALFWRTEARNFQPQMNTDARRCIVRFQRPWAMRRVSMRDLPTLSNNQLDDDGCSFDQQFDRKPPEIVLSNDRPRLLDGWSGLA